MIGKLAEIGWLFKKLKTDLNRDSKGKLGLVFQSFCGALDKELSEYYRLIAMLEQQFQMNGSSAIGEGLTFRRLLVWLQQPLQRMRWMGILAEGVHLQKFSAKGGALISQVMKYSSMHGSPSFKVFVNNLVLRVRNKIYILVMTLELSSHFINGSFMGF
jgi:gamma-tubulin complex component 3